MLADGGEAIADLSVLRDQTAPCSGRSPPTPRPGDCCRDSTRRCWPSCVPRGPKLGRSPGPSTPTQRRCRAGPTSKATPESVSLYVSAHRRTRPTRPMPQTQPTHTTPPTPALRHPSPYCSPPPTPADPPNPAGVRYPTGTASTPTTSPTCSPATPATATPSSTPTATQPLPPPPNTYTADPTLAVTNGEHPHVRPESPDGHPARNARHGAGLVLATLPRLSIDSRDPYESQAIGAWQDCCAPAGLLLVLVTTEPNASGHRSTVIAAARTAGLLYHQHIPTLLVPLPEAEPRTTPARPRPARRISSSPHAGLSSRVPFPAWHVRPAVAQRG